MYTNNNAINGRMAKVLLGVLAVALFSLMNVTQTQAQIVSPVPSPTVSYSFNVPVSKAVPNPCTGGVALITGTMNFSIKTTSDSSGFSYTVTSNSSGRGEDALADGSLLLDGTQRPKYLYTSAFNSDASFNSTPSSSMQDLVIGDYLTREYGNYSDSFTLRTSFELNFVNGVPSAPILRSIDTRCN